MNWRRVVQFSRREGVAETGRQAVDRLKDVGNRWVDLQGWTQYHRRKNALFFDVRSLAYPFALRWIDPNLVQYRSQYGYFDRVANLGNVRQGRWDRRGKQVSDHATYRGLYQRFVEGRAWEDTAYVEDNVKRIRDGNVKKGCQSVEEFLEVRCPYVDELYTDIKENGYHPQHEIGAADIDRNRHDPEREFMRTNEVGVNIARDGELLLNSGFHRLAIAQILDLDRIPVLVIVRHWSWQRIREHAVDRPGPKTREPHPDLVDVLGV